MQINDRVCPVSGQTSLANALGIQLEFFNFESKMFILLLFVSIQI